MRYLQNVHAGQDKKDAEFMARRDNCGVAGGDSDESGTESEMDEERRHRNGDSGRSTIK